MKSHSYTETIESKLSETEINKKCVDYVKGLRFRAYRMNSGKVKVRGGWMKLQEKSCPDYLFNVKGCWVWFEGKKSGKEASKAQAEHHEELKASGDYVICTDGYNEFIKQFNEVLKEIKSK